MAHASNAPDGPVVLDAALLAAAARQAAAAADDPGGPGRAMDAAVGALHDAIAGIFPSVFVFEHGRLWLVAQRGYAVVPDGIRIQRGIMGRAVRLGRAQHATDVSSDPDYMPALPGITAELALPLRAGEVVVGVLNLESERGLPGNADELMEPLAAVLAPLAGALRTGRTFDLPALARLFVHLGSLRDPDEIAGMAADTLPKVLPVETSQVFVWNDPAPPTELASWRAEGCERPLLDAAQLDAARAFVDPTVVCQLLRPSRSSSGDSKLSSLVWLPLRVNGVEIGAVAAASLVDESVDPADLDTAAVLAAHVAASLDAAFAFQRERQSAVTDSLTGVLNRRGLEERLDRGLHAAQERRLPLSLIVIDCDDFKEINDRAGHAFGDGLLKEIADLLERAVPPDAAPARLGGDEFVVMLPGVGLDEATRLGGRMRTLISEELTDAGYPLRISAGIATYPFDGATPTELLRAADQALYAAKYAGKDQVASFRDVRRPEALLERSARMRDRRGSRSDGSILGEAVAATAAMDREQTAHGVCERLCKALVFAVGATACSISTIADGYLVDAASHSVRDVWLGDDAAYRIEDFPVTAEVLRTGEPRAVSFIDGDVDPAEAFVLRGLAMNAMLMLAVRVDDEPWGLVELYEMRLRRFGTDEIAIAEFLTRHAERRLAVVGTRTPLRPWPPVYELPSDDAPPRGPRTR